MAIEAVTSLLSADARSFIGGTTPRYATLATINKDGSPHQIVIWFLLRGDELVINSRRGRRWPANLERDGHASLAIYEAEDNVIVNCEVARVYEGDQAQADIAEMAQRYDAPQVAAVGIARYRTEQRVSFVMTPRRVLIHGDPR